MHEEFMRGKITIIGCPKLDDIDYSEKLQQIIEHNDIQSVTVVRMEVPCCGGLEHAAVTALKNSGKFIPWQVVTISIDRKDSQTKWKRDRSWKENISKASLCRIYYT